MKCSPIQNRYCVFFHCISSSTHTFAAFRASNCVQTRPILLSDTDKSMGKCCRYYRKCWYRNGIGEFTSLYTDQIPYHIISGKKRYPATSQLAQLALTDITYLKAIFFVTQKQYSGSWAVLPLVTTIVKR